MPLLETVGVTRRYGPVAVLRDVNLVVNPGEIVALVGETGAGKSTLVSCLARVLDADEGQMRLDGRPLPATADRVRRAGLEVVWQDHGLCDDLDVVANIHLGREDRLLSRPRLRQHLTNNPEIDTRQRRRQQLRLRMELRRIRKQHMQQ